MGWKDIDLFEMEASSFSEQLHSVIVPLFEDGTVILQKWERERRESFEKMIAEAKGEEQGVDFAYNLADLEKWRNMQRSQVLGAAGLHYIYSALKSGLKDLARYFDKTHPRSPNGYKGESELDRLKEEFAQRLQVDFKKSTLFNAMRELALARNAGIHSDVRDYTAKVASPRFYKGGEFHVDRDGFMWILGETEKFFSWVVEQMLPLRKAQIKVVGKPNATPSSIEGSEKEREGPKPLP
jgi:hypothetical protein